jgi:thiamine kinase-like enzyme
VSAADFEPLAEVLRRHGLAGKREHPFSNDGWSGASLTTLSRGSDRFILKRDSLARDWIAQATADGPTLREAWFAAHGPPLPSPIRAPYLGVGMDGDEFGILMPDLTGVLFDWDAPISDGSLDRVLAGLATLHTFPFDDALPLGGPHWCPLRDRLTLICRASLERPGAAHDAVGDRILPGWDAFDREAPRAARDLINQLGERPQLLVDALAALPSTLIHGDLKLANVGIEPDGTIDLVDWQMVMVAPVAVELGWFLVSNVASLPWTPTRILERYREKAEVAEFDAEDDHGGAVPNTLDWERQVDAAILVGLVLRGWRKGADTEARLTLASGISAADDLAWWCERAVIAAERIL